MTGNGSPRWRLGAGRFAQRTPTRERAPEQFPPMNLARASASGAITLAVAQIIDIRLTGRPPSDTPVLAVERLIGHSVKGRLLRSVLGYGVQSSLAPGAAFAASRAGGRPAGRFAAAFLAPFAFVAIVNPAIGASTWPWRWTVQDWVREFTLKSALAVAVTATL